MEPKAALTERIEFYFERLDAVEVMEDVGDQMWQRVAAFKVEAPITEAEIVEAAMRKVVAGKHFRVVLGLDQRTENPLCAYVDLDRRSGA